MSSISRLCKEFNLSRSTLLYYDSIGLLKASIRTQVITDYIPRMTERG